MKELIEAYTFLKHIFSTSVVWAIILTSIAFYIQAKIKEFIKASEARDESAKKELELLKLKVDKIMGVMFLCPGVDESNKWWLKNDKQNSAPPGKTSCPFKSKCEEHKPR